MSDAEILTAGRLLRALKSGDERQRDGVLRLARSLSVDLSDRRFYTQREWPEVIAARILGAERRARARAAQRGAA
jgi:hypothetical protein